MASTTSFEWVSQELERITSLERLEARGTLRLTLKKAGLEASQVTAKQMEVVLRELLPGELRSRGVEEGDEACEHLLESGLVLHRVQHLSQGHQLRSIQLVADEGVEIVPPLFAVHHNVRARRDLVLHTAPNLAVRHAIELAGCHAPLLFVAQRAQQITGSRPATHLGYGKHGSFHQTMASFASSSTAFFRVCASGE